MLSAQEPSRDANLHTVSVRDGQEDTVWTNTWTNFSDLDHTLAALDLFRRNFERALTGSPIAQDDGRFDVKDDGESYVVQAVLPGIPANALELTLTGQSLKVRAHRKVNAPEGYVAHRRERPTFDLVRSFSLPTRVDAEKVTAVAKDGIVTITLPKAADAKPRSITVQAT
jgi:HSP20 family protein